DVLAHARKDVADLIRLSGERARDPLLVLALARQLRSLVGIDALGEPRRVLDLSEVHAERALSREDLAELITDEHEAVDQEPLERALVDDLEEPHLRLADVSHRAPVRVLLVGDPEVLGEREELEASARLGRQRAPRAQRGDVEPELGRALA